MPTTSKRIGQHLSAALPHRRFASLLSIVAIMAKGLCFAVLAATFTPSQAAAANDAAQSPTQQLSAHKRAAAPIGQLQPMVADRPKRANFELAHASHEARSVADWVVDSGDNRGMPFAIVDKVDAKVFVFDAGGRLRGAAAALLGLALGDDAVPGIGDRAMSSIRPEERTTPAGRFLAALDRNSYGKEILWVDYEDAISMHPVITTKPEERRAQRLATPTPLDNRISYGCINVPAKFFKNVVRPAFTGTNGIVYVLPEIRLASQVFASYDVEEHARLQAARQSVATEVSAAHRQ